MSDFRTYIINKPSVVGEVIDSELVAIHLQTGCYYHANPAGAAIWACIERGMNNDAMIDYLVHRYGIGEDRIQKDTAIFIERLIQEQLIRVEDNAVGARSESVPMPDTVLEYQEPVLKKHEDMKELLLLDPIHDVGENAWPMQEVM